VGQSRSATKAKSTAINAGPFVRGVKGKTCNRFIRSLRLETVPQRELHDTGRTGAWDLPKFPEERLVLKFMWFKAMNASPELDLLALGDGAER